MADTVKERGDLRGKGKKDKRMNTLHTKHVEFSEGGDGGGEVPLGIIKFLDILGDFLDHLLGLLRLVADLPHFGEEFVDAFLGILQFPLALLPSRCLTTHDVTNLGVEFSDPQPEPGQHLVNIYQRLLCNSEGERVRERC